VKYNLLLFIAALLLLSAATVFDVNFFDYKSPVPYSHWRTITFYDFKGYKRPGETLFGNTAFAFIKTNRQTRLINDTAIEVTSYFHPSRSYVFEQQVRSPDLLQHELYHFHITEYCTRLLKKELMDYKQPFTQSKLEEMNEKYMQFENNMQMTYDDESYHSYVLKEQKKWEKFIDSSLAQLELYSTPVISFKKNL
jgi:hypothetical protein